MNQRNEIEKKNQRLFAVLNNISFSLSPLYINYLFIRYLDAQNLQISIFLFALINTVGLTLFLAVDLAMPKFLLDPKNSQNSTFHAFLRTNFVYGTATICAVGIGLFLQNINMSVLFPSAIYIYSTALFFTCRSFLGGSNNFAGALYLTTVDLILTCAMVFIVLNYLEVSFELILVTTAICHLLASLYWIVFKLPRPEVSNTNENLRLITFYHTKKSTLKLIPITSGLQLLYHLPLLIISASSVSSVILVQITVSTQIARGLFGLLSGISARNFNIINEYYLGLTNVNPKSVLFLYFKIIGVVFVFLYIFLVWQGPHIFSIYSSEKVSFSLEIMFVALFLESLMNIFGMLRLIFVANGRISLLNIVLVATIFMSLVLSSILHTLEFGILLSFTMSVLLGSILLYFFSLSSKKLDRN